MEDHLSGVVTKQSTVYARRSSTVGAGAYKRRGQQTVAVQAAKQQWLDELASQGFEARTLAWIQRVCVRALVAAPGGVLIASLVFYLGVVAAFHLLVWMSPDEYGSVKLFAPTVGTEAELRELAPRTRRGVTDREALM